MGLAWFTVVRAGRLTRLLQGLREKTAMADVLNVEVREQVGTKRMRRLRKTGKIPAVLYGHKEAVLNLAVKHEELAAVIRHSGKLVKLSGGLSEDALIRQVQWDTYGKYMLHVDLIRV